MPVAQAAVRMTGVCKFYSAVRRFGFVIVDDTAASHPSDELFFHERSIVDIEPQANDRVTFVIGHDKNGKPRAEHVRII